MIHNNFEPDFCTSLICNKYNNKYCFKCSHAFFLGEGEDRNGHVWRWEFSPRFGPLFVGKRGEPLSRQPVDEKHRAWGPFDKWHDELIKKTINNRKKE